MSQLIKLGPGDEDFLRLVMEHPAVYPWVGGRGWKIPDYSIYWSHPEWHLYKTADNGGFLFFEERPSDGKIYMHLAFLPGYRGIKVLQLVAESATIVKSLGYQEIFCEVADHKKFRHVRKTALSAGFVPVEKKETWYELEFDQGLAVIEIMRKEV